LLIIIKYILHYKTIHPAGVRLSSEDIIEQYTFCSVKSYFINTLQTAIQITHINNQT